VEVRAYAPVVAADPPVASDLESLVRRRAALLADREEAHIG
jgi:hypothetical protein